MQLVGFVFIVFAIWFGYCGLNSFKPASLALDIINRPADASAILTEAHSQVESTKGSFGGSLVATGGTSPAGANLLTMNGIFGPFSSYSISDSFDAHVARGSSAPGIDFVMPSGTALYSPFSGTLHNSPDPSNSTEAGNEVWVTLADGYQFVIMHLSQLIPGLEGTQVSAGQLIGYSGGDTGAPGSGDAQGAHAHVGLETPSGQWVPFTQHAFG